MNPEIMQDCYPMYNTGTSLIAQSWQAIKVLDTPPLTIEAGQSSGTSSIV